KGNIGKPPPKLQYDIQDGPDPEANPHGIFTWVGEYTGPTGDDVSDEVKKEVPFNREPKKLGAAREFLRQALANGPKSFAELVEAAQQLKITERTLRRATDGIAEPVQISEGNWVWVLTTDK